MSTKREHIQGKGGPGRMENLSTGSAKTILIVDDAKVSRDMMRAIFIEEYNVMEAENGAEALKIMEREREAISIVVLDLIMPVLDGYGVLEKMSEDRELSNIPVLVVTAAGEDTETQIKVFDRGADDMILKPVNVQLLRHRVRNIIARHDLYIANEQNKAFAERLTLQQEELIRSKIDDKTGIYNKNAFFDKAEELIKSDPDRLYCIVRWDIDKFKVYNGIFGMAEGDRLLKHIGDQYRKAHIKGMVYAHFDADHFVSCLPAAEIDLEEWVSEATEWLSKFNTGFEFTPRCGVYVVEDTTIDVRLMCDRALLALRSIKGMYGARYAYYDIKMSYDLVREQKIVNEMETALEEKQFIVYLQPQYNYRTGEIIGAESLVRWDHPEKGLLAPGSFIPVLERNGLITRLDKYVWEESCRMIRQWIDDGIGEVSLSMNMSRQDFYDIDLFGDISDLVDKYRLTPDLVRFEVTESAYMDNLRHMIGFVKRLQQSGFMVEMDDFGSGYSSLNTLKDLPVDMLKLDLKFLKSNGRNDRSGKILTSIVRMASWVDMPVIAEGVETKEQAEFLKSIGCSLMQGYLFAKPMPESEFRKLLEKTCISGPMPIIYDTDLIDAVDFLEESIQSTMLFNSFVGGAAVIALVNDSVEALRINERYYEVLGTDSEEYNIDRPHFLKRFDDENRKLFLDMLHDAVKSGHEEKCVIHSDPYQEGGKDLYTLARVRFLTQRVEEYIFYLEIEDVRELKEMMIPS